MCFFCANEGVRSEIHSPNPFRGLGLTLEAMDVSIPGSPNPGWEFHWKPGGVHVVFSLKASLVITLWQMISISNLDIAGFFLCNISANARHWILTIFSNADDNMASLVSLAVTGFLFGRPAGPHRTRGGKLLQKQSQDIQKYLLQ